MFFIIFTCYKWGWLIDKVNVLTGEQGFYPVTNFMEMEDVDFNESGQHS